MTLDEAVAIVERTLPAGRLRVDRKLVRHDETAYLLIVLDTRQDLDDGDTPIDNGPRLVIKESGLVTRLTVPAAIARARDMTRVRS